MYETEGSISYFDFVERLWLMNIVSNAKSLFGLNTQQEILDPIWPGLEYHTQNKCLESQKNNHFLLFM